MIAWLIHVTGNPMAPAWYLLLAISCSLVAMILMTGTVSRCGQTPSQWAFFLVLAAGVLTLAWLDRRYMPLTWIAAGLLWLTLTGWSETLKAPLVPRFLLTALANGALFGVGGWVAARIAPPRGRQSADEPHAAGTWAALSAFCGLAFNFSFFVFQAIMRSIGRPRVPLPPTRP